MMNPNTHFYRKLAIIVIDLIAIVWLVRETYFAGGLDSIFGVIFLFYTGGLLIYNVYAVGLFQLFAGKGRGRLYIEVLYISLLIIPLLVLWHFT